MIRIDSQKKLHKARRKIEFCYLCGKSLPSRRSREWKRGVTNEHVIPKSLLRESPSNPRDSWRVVLDVHSACEKSAKQKGDELLALLHKINTIPPSEWPKTGRIRKLGFAPAVFEMPDGTGVPAMTNAARIIRGAWNWIRGLHAVLYSEFIPHEMTCTVLPPVPAYDTKPGGAPHEETDFFSLAVRKLAALGLEGGSWDGIVALGGQLRYACRWFAHQEATAREQWCCLWVLVLPDVLEWSRSVLPVGQERPWHGGYITGECPRDATIIEPK